MNKLNQWITLFANIGVLVSIMILTFEIRQNTSQMQVEASFSMNQSLNALNASIYSDSKFADIYIRGCKSLENLNELEKAQFRAYAFDMLNLYIFDNELKEQDIGNIHTNISDVMITRFRSNPGLKEFLSTIESEWAAGDELYENLTGKKR